MILIKSQGCYQIYRHCLILISALLLSLPIQADFSALIISPVNQARVAVASFSWQIPIVEQGYPERASVVDLFAFRLGRTPPLKGPAQLVISKLVATEIEGVSENCGSDQPLAELHVEIPVWGKHMPTDELYFQHFVLKQVTVDDCQHNKGAKAEALWLGFTDISKQGEPRPLPDE